MQPENILFDEQNIAEVSEFTLSESIPEGETHINGRVAGALGLIAPDYMLTGLCSEKSDVFSFGVLLLETGDDYWLLPHVKKYNENNRFNEISSNCNLLHVLLLNLPRNHQMIGQQWLMLQNNSDKYIDYTRNFPESHILFKLFLICNRELYLHHEPICIQFSSLRTGLLMIIFTVLVNPILRIAMETANALALYPVASDQQEYCWMNSL
ncbi:hypothetical protein ACOSP7_008736 [Xanthoceras sorbifolium]